LGRRPPVPAEEGQIPFQLERRFRQMSADAVNVNDAALTVIRGLGCNSARLSLGQWNLLQTATL
jgi:hypothetical protein